MRRWIAATVGGGPLCVALVLACISTVIGATGSVEAEAAAPVSVRVAHTRSSVPEEVYVANGGLAVTAYLTRSHGNVTGRVAAADPHLNNTVWDPWTVAFGPGGELYVQSFVSDATSFVFAAPFGPTRQPVRIFRGDGPDSRAITVDGSGYEYVATGEAAAQIVVLAPDANGNPDQLYAVAPIRRINTDEAVWHPWPEILSVQGRLLVAALSRSAGNAIDFFQAGATGTGTPVRVIAGTHTGLGSCPGQTCDHLVVTFSPLTGRLYVGVSTANATRILVFSSAARGDVRPLQTIAGTSTGLVGKVITGIGDSQHDGTIYAMVKDAQWATGRIEAFAESANGDVKPLRTFVDNATGFADAQGIAVR